MVKTPAVLAGRREGAARSDGAPADQPPAGLPDLRQGWRVPAAEPGDVQRPVESRFPTSSAPTRSRSRSPRRCCSTASAACCVPAAPGSPRRSPATRSSSCSSAARWSRSRSTPDEPYQSYFSGNVVQICPVGALTGAVLPVPVPAVRPRLDSERLRALLVRLLAAHRLAARQGDAPAGRRRPRGQRGVELRQGPVGVQLRPREPTGSPPRWSGARRRAARRPPGRRRSSGPREGLLEARDAGGVGVLPGGRLTYRGRLRLQQVRPAWRSAPTTSTSAPGRTRPRSWTSCAAVGRRVRSPLTGGVTYHRPRARAGPSCWWASSRRRSRRSSSSGCARRNRRHGARIFGIAPFATTGAGQVSGGRCCSALPAWSRRSSTLSRRAAATSPTSPPRCTPTARSSSSASGWPGARRLSRVARLAAATGARVAWVPRRAGERGAVEAGALPTMLPGGRLVADPVARHELERIWESRLPETPGRDADGILRRGPRRRARRRWSSAGSTSATCPTRPGRRGAHRGRIRRQPRAAALLRHRARRRGAAGRPSRARRTAATSTGRAGSARSRQTVHQVGALTDGRVLDTVAAELGVDLGLAECRGDPPRRSPTCPGPGTAPPPAPDYAAGAVPAPRAGSGRAGDLAPPARPSAGCRTASRTWPAPPASARAASSAGTAAEIGAPLGSEVDGVDRAGCDHAAAADRRPAGPGGLAAHQLGRFARCAATLGVDAGMS